MSEHLSTEQHARLADMAYQIRRLSVEMIAWAQWGHIGGSFSMAEMLAVLYFHAHDGPARRPDVGGPGPAHPVQGARVAGLYAALALRGYFPDRDVYTYCELGGRLEGHTDMTRTPGLESSGGPLGMGLSVAVGRALGLRYKLDPRARVFCILGDGECNEGNVWEAAMAAAHYHLDNLIAVVDYNKVMAKGFTHDQMSVEPFADKWRAFGWEVVEVDGHDLDELADAFHRARWILPHGQPIVIIAHTVKGKGVEIAEFNPKWHTHAPDGPTADRDAARAGAATTAGPRRATSRLERPGRQGGLLWRRMSRPATTAGDARRVRARARGAGS